MMGHEWDNSLDDWPDLGWDEEGHDSRPSLLIGNGFSQNIWSGFRYASLFDKASQSCRFRLNDKDRGIFSTFKTDNFELVLNALMVSKAVSKSLDQNYELLQHHENRIRKVLIQAVHGVHISSSRFPEENRMKISTELAKYMSIYYINYDLLIYWSIMKYGESHKNHFFDYLWSNPFDTNNVEVWNKKTRSGVYFLHGSLHLYKNIIDQTYKHINCGMNLLELFESTDQHEGNTDEIPLFISEGTYHYKLRSIHQSDYLSFLFSCFEKDTNPLVILGHSLGDSDQHIANAINAHQGRPVAVSVRKNGDICQRKAAISRALPKVRLYFFDAATHPLLHESLRIEESSQ